MAKNKILFSVNMVLSVVLLVYFFVSVFKHFSMAEACNLVDSFNQLNSINNWYYGLTSVVSVLLILFILRKANYQWVYFFFNLLLIVAVFVGKFLVNVLVPACY